MSMILPIKKKWFDMILSGKKKEEYREVKPYYTTRFEKIFKEYPIGNNLATVIFRNGYSTKAPAIEAECMLRKGKGKPEWGAEPGVDYYILVILAIKNVDFTGQMENNGYGSDSMDAITRAL